jgi:RNA polymerase sporulation-specific sigma factor
MVSVFLIELGTKLADGLMTLISYISSGTVFPQPLSTAEKEEYLERLAQGDEEAKKILIEHNMRLVAHIVKKYDNTGVNAEDLISIGSIGLIKAIETFDINKNARLTTYAARCIENEILMHLRKTKRSKEEKSLYEPIGADKEGNEITLIDILGTAINQINDQVELTLESEKLYQKLKELDQREQKVLEMRYGLEDGKKRTQKQIANKLGISRSYVSRIEKKAVENLCDKFRLEGY